MANKPVTEKLFRKKLNISPTFLQTALKPGSFTPGDYISPSADTDYKPKLFQDSDKVFKLYADPDDDPGYLSNHKLRITSKKSRRRFDINVIFSYKKMSNFDEVPEGAELVYEAVSTATTAPQPAPPTDADVKPCPPSIGKCIHKGVPPMEVNMNECDCKGYGNIWISLDPKDYGLEGLGKDEKTQSAVKKCKEIGKPYPANAPCPCQEDKDCKNPATCQDKLFGYGKCK